MFDKGKSTWCCIFIVLIAIEATGIYFLNKALNDPQGKEISQVEFIVRKWNETYSEFKDLNVNIHNVSLSKNHTQTWGVNIENFPYYQVWFFSSHVNFSYRYDNLKIIKSNSGTEYNITVDLVLTIKDQNLTERTSKIDGVVLHSRKKSNMNIKVCGNEHMGYWDGSVCYHDYHTNHLCFVVNSNYSLINNYERGCDDVSYYKQEKIKYVYKEVYSNLTVNPMVEVRSELDPMVYSAYNGVTEFSPSSKEYKIIGICLVVISSTLLVISGFLTLCLNRRRKYLNMQDLHKI